MSYNYDAVPNIEMKEEPFDAELEAFEDNFPEHLKTFKCDSCDKSFSRHDHLKRHTATVHEGLRNYGCAFCEKSYSRPDHLKNHVSTVHFDKLPPPKTEADDKQKNGKENSGMNWVYYKKC